MAKKKQAETAPAKAAGIDPAGRYRVRLARAVRIGRRLVTGDNVRLRGDVLQAVRDQHPDAVTSYEIDA